MAVKELLFGRKAPKVRTHLGKAQTIAEKELDESSCGISFHLPVEPDYEALRLRQVAQADAYEAFHASASGLFSEETAAVFGGYLAQLEEAYCRYLESITTTHAGQLHTMKLNALDEASSIQEKGTTK